MNDKSQWHFIKRVIGSSTMHSDLYDYDEVIKDRVLDIQKNGIDFDNETWLSYYYMQQREIWDAMLKNPYTPDDIVKKIVEKTTDSKKILDLLRLRALPEEIIDMILKDSDHWRNIRTEAFTSYSKNQKMNIHQENIHTISRLKFFSKGSPLEDSKYCILAFVKDENLIELMARSEYLNEHALQYMVDNVYISEELKNKLFDGIGFNFNDIECPSDALWRNITPYISEKVYETAIDTIDGVVSGKITKPYGCTKEVLRLEAETMIGDLALQHVFTEATQLDYLHRFKDMEDKRISEDTVKTILKCTRYPSVLDFAYDSFNKNIKAECIKNNNASYRILSDAMNLFTKQIQKAIKSEKGNVPAITEQRIAIMAKRVSMTPEQMEATLMWFGNHSSIIDNACECPNNAKDVFEKINERLKNGDSSTYAKLAVKTRIVMDGEYFNIVNLMLKFIRIGAYTRLDSLSCNMNVMDCQYAKEIASKPELYEKYKQLVNELKTKFELTKPEQDVVEAMEIIFDVNKERLGKDKYFNPEVNSTYYLQQKMIAIGTEIVRCPTLCELYMNIDQWQEEYNKIEEVIYQRDDYREWKRLIDEREI